MQRHLLASLLAVAACGGDDDQPPPAANQPAAAAAAQQKAAVDRGKLSPRKHIEDNVTCPIPDKPTGPLCEPMLGSGAAPSGRTLADCDTGLYCLQVGNLQFSCEPCPERDSIRHEFKDRDFAVAQARDPFQSFVIIQGDIGPDASKPKVEPHQSCKTQDQFVALNYSYQDLKLVGIVAQGTQRKVLMMDSGNLGHIIKRGDCVGKEKAVVKDIGTGYVTFVVEEDPDTKRPAQENSFQLHPGGIDVEPPPQSAPNLPSTAPSVEPPRSLPPPPAIAPPKKP